MPQCRGLSGGGGRQNLHVSSSSLPVQNVLGTRSNQHAREKCVCVCACVCVRVCVRARMRARMRVMNAWIARGVDYIMEQRLLDWVEGIQLSA